MPIYEYEPVDYNCLICGGRFEALQAIDDEPLSFCPTCGLDVRRVVSQVTTKVKIQADYDRAAKKGLTTFRRVEEGKWEKVAGDGVDMIVGTPEDQSAVKEEQKPPKVIDLDQG